MRSLFGTDGIRGPVGSGTFTREKLIQLGSSIARWALATWGPGASLLITQDTRISGDMIKACLKSGLLAHPVRVTDTFVLPTPAMAHFLKEGAFHCALIISASHNPYYDNGIKIMKAESSKLSPQDEFIITQYMNDYVEHIPAFSGTDTPLFDASGRYRELVKSHFPEDMLRNIQVVLDTAHGATSFVAPLIFKELGAEVITLHQSPTGSNINEGCGSLYPQALQKAVIEHKAHVGFAFDGDGDRLIAVNHRGIVKDGDDILAVLLSHDAYAHTPEVVGTVMSNGGLAQFVTAREKRLTRTAVGDKYIAERLVKHNLVLGGEPSGHIILRDLLSTGDGILVALRLLETMLQQGNMTLESFTKYPQILCHIPVTCRKELTHEPIATMITQAEAALQPGRVLVRYSGTEPVLRVMVEAESHALATKYCTELVNKLTEALT